MRRDAVQLTKDGHEFLWSEFVFAAAIVEFEAMIHVLKKPNQSKKRSGLDLKATYKQPDERTS